MILDIVRPRTVDEAVRAKSAPGAAYLGGGTWLNSGRAEGARVLISLENLALGTIEASGNRCTIGATVTFQRMRDAAGIPGVLRAAAALTASRTLRNMKTIGGELGLRLEDSALLPVLIALDAEVRLAGGGPANSSTPVPIGELLARPPGDLILSVILPDASRPGAVRAVSRTSHSRRSVVAAVVGTPPRIVVSDCCGQRVRLASLERILRGAALPPRERIEEAVRAEFSPSPDMHASAEYKRYIAGVCVADALGVL